MSPLAIVHIFYLLTLPFIFLLLCYSRARNRCLLIFVHEIDFLFLQLSFFLFDFLVIWLDKSSQCITSCFASKKAVWMLSVLKLLALCGFCCVSSHKIRLFLFLSASLPCCFWLSFCFCMSLSEKGCKALLFGPLFINSYPATISGSKSFKSQLVQFARIVKTCKASKLQE